MQIFSRCFTQRNLANWHVNQVFDVKMLSDAECEAFRLNWNYFGALSLWRAAADLNIHEWRRVKSRPLSKNTKEDAPGSSCTGHTPKHIATHTHTNGVKKCRRSAQFFKNWNSAQLFFFRNRIKIQIKADESKMKSSRMTEDVHPGRHIADNWTHRSGRRTPKNCAPRNHRAPAPYTPTGVTHEARRCTFFVLRPLF